MSLVMVFIGVLGTSRSTAKNAMLVMSIVAARNMFERYRAVLVSDGQLLTLSRVMALPTAMVACLVAYWKPEPGILLVIAAILRSAFPTRYSRGGCCGNCGGHKLLIVAHFVTPAGWADLNTLVPPVLIWISFVTVMKLTRMVEIADLPEALPAHGD